MNNPLNPEDMIPNQMNERLKSIEKLLQELVELARQLVQNTQDPERHT